jgi:hypothetical protein
MTYKPSRPDPEEDMPEIKTLRDELRNISSEGWVSVRAKRLAKKRLATKISRRKKQLRDIRIEKENQCINLILHKRRQYFLFKLWITQRPEENADIEIIPEEPDGVKDIEGMSDDELERWKNELELMFADTI